MLETTIHNNPRCGAISTISTFLFGMLPNVNPNMQNLVIFWFQVIAFSISIIVGIFTIVGYVRKFRKKQKQDDQL